MESAQKWQGIPSPSTFLSYGSATDAQRYGQRSEGLQKTKKLDSDCTEAVLLTARDKEDELFDRMAEGLNSANARELVAAAAQKSALAYLSARGIDIGVARRLQFAQCNNLKIEFDLELQENVAEAAWRLVNGEPEDIEEATLVSVAFNAYKRTCIPKYARVLDRFLAANEDRQLNENVDKVVSKWTTNQLQTRGWATVKKDQAIICSALKQKLNQLGAGIRIFGFSFKEAGGAKRFVAKQRDIMTKEELTAVFRSELDDRDRWALILSITCGAINSEILPVALDAGAIGILDGYPLVRFPQGKSHAWRRHVPVP